MGAIKFIKVLLLIAARAWALQQKELEDWFASSNGLAMSRSEASHAASRSWTSLAQCGVEVQTLQKLKDPWDPS